MKPLALGISALAAILGSACGGSDHDGASLRNDSGADVYGASYQGAGVQCGAIVCAASQQCCFVYLPADGSTSGPTHACDQDCESVCADTCPDAGGTTQSFPPSPTSMAGGPPMGMPEGGPMAPPPGMTPVSPSTPPDADAAP